MLGFCDSWLWSAVSFFGWKFFHSAVEYSPRTRLNARILWLVLLKRRKLFWFFAPPARRSEVHNDNFHDFHDFSGFSRLMTFFFFLNKFSFDMHFPCILQCFFSRLWRGDLRYTKIFFYSAVSLNFFRASGEAIWGTLKFFPKIFRSRVSKEFSRERAQRENRLGWRGPNLRKGRAKKKKRKERKIVP